MKHIVVCVMIMITDCFVFCVLLTVHPGMILVNNQIDAHFFMYLYFYCLRVSNSNVPIIRRIIVIATLGLCHCVWMNVWYAG